MLATGFVLQSRFSSQEQFRVLHERYPLVSNSTKGLLLSTYLKVLLSDPSNSGLQGDVTAVFNKCSHQMDPDLQQRGAEYLVSVPLGEQESQRVHQRRHLSVCTVLDTAMCLQGQQSAMPVDAQNPPPACVLPWPLCLCLQVLAQNPGQSVQHFVLPMPKWPVRESALLRRLAVGGVVCCEGSAATCVSC